VVRKYFRWLFWNTYYLFGYPRNFREYLEAGMRCRWPWWKFKPHMHYNKDGKQWEVWFKDEPSYSGKEFVSLQVHRSQETRGIVGFTIHEEELST
jgi:hypothetical protein